MAQRNAVRNRCLARRSVSALAFLIGFMTSNTSLFLDSIFLHVYWPEKGVTFQHLSPTGHPLAEYAAGKCDR